MTPSPSAPRRPGRPARPDNAVARDNLLDVATALFAAKGVAATTIAHIAQQAGVTPAMVHYYFKNRDQLIEQVIIERVLPVIAFVWAPVPLETPASHDAAKLTHRVIVEIVTRLVQSASERPWLPSLWIHEVVNEGGQLREGVLRQLPAEHIKAFGKLIAQSQQQGAISRGVEPRLVFLSVLSLTLLPMATANVWRRVWQADDGTAPDIDNHAIANHAITLLTGGLFSASEPGTPAPTSGR